MKTTIQVHAHIKNRNDNERCYKETILFYFDEEKVITNDIMKILIVCDIENWAIDHLAKSVQKFNQPHHDNLCFYRIGEVPGGKIFQHYLRICKIEDVNEEVLKYMQMALLDVN